ncbi:MerR family transcriptional regulator [Amorphoplanes nipponensis]|uniref:MerR family transcriptional regulator n=1 Tax=Actinoplanes nipponensis TaxID=135950 RepID=A0A919JKS9_9ACTN|nr:MerR family transcriptional regulator [Actinoplanes nipponensis]GIE48609.1 MerR family transcriptional regulator [Actinoplanes nipponensis]
MAERLSGLLTTGEFARRSRLSVKALRLYDRSGLLRPAEVHPGTGYRRYAEHQLYAARLIVLLRRLDMPLTQIAAILDAGGADAGARLARYWTDVERRLAAQRDLADRLVRSLAGEAVAPAGDWPVATREVPEQLVLTEQRYVTSAGLGWTREAAARLTEVARRHGGPAGPRFVVFHGEVGEDGDGPVEVCVPVPAGAVDPATVAVRREPAHREAYIPVIRGHFEAPQILSVYDAARRWVRARGMTVAAPPREVYAYPADLDHGAPDDLMCDVAVPYA